MCLCGGIYKVGENVADDLDYWLSSETATSVTTLPGANEDNSTKQCIGPDDNDRSAAVSMS